jgi:hypothetical protein
MEVMASTSSTLAISGVNEWGKRRACPWWWEVIRKRAVGDIRIHLLSDPQIFRCYTGVTRLPVITHMTTVTAHIAH